MSLNRTNTVSAILLLATVLGTTATRVDYSKPNIEVLPDMKYTPAWTAFQENPHFSNRQTLQPPVAGSIPRGRSPLHYAATKEDAARAGAELTNPLAGADYDEGQLRASIERGGGVYRVFCVSCHGAGGMGDGPVAKRGFPPPPSLLSGNSLKMKDGQLFHIVSFGQGSMAGFAGQLARAQRWDVVNYVRSLQPTADIQLKPPNAEPSDAGSSNTEQPERKEDE